MISLDDMLTDLELLVNTESTSLHLDLLEQSAAAVAEVGAAVATGRDRGVRGEPVDAAVYAKAAAGLRALRHLVDQDVGQLARRVAREEDRKSVV